MKPRLGVSEKKRGNKESPEGRQVKKVEMQPHSGRTRTEHIEATAKRRGLF